MAATAIETAFQGGWSLEDRRSLYELQSLLGDEWTAQHRTVLASHLSMKDWMDLAFAVRAASTLLTSEGDWDDLSLKKETEIKKGLEWTQDSVDALKPLARGDHFSVLTRLLHRRQFSTAANSSSSWNRQPGGSADTR